MMVTWHDQVGLAQGLIFEEGSYDVGIYGPQMVQCNHSFLYLGKEFKIGLHFYSIYVSKYART